MSPFHVRIKVSSALTMAPTLVQIWSWRHPKRCHYPTEQTRINKSSTFCKHCEVGKISRHYGVGHGCVPCWPYFHVKSKVWRLYSMRGASFNGCKVSYLKLCHPSILTGCLEHCAGPAGVSCSWKLVHKTIQYLKTLHNSSNSTS